MMTPEEIRALNETNAKVATEQRRLTLAARLDRLREHVERVGQSPEFIRAIDDAQAELEAPRQGTP